MTFPARHVSVSITRPADDVYGFASNPANLPRWAAGLSSGIEHVNGQWFAESPMGQVRVQFAPDNAFGVLDHDVTLPSGQTVNNPMRVVPNGAGCEVIFTLYRRPEMSEQEFEADAGLVLSDLRRLKALLEA